MFDLRPVVNVVGLLLAVLGATMLLPAWMDWRDGNGHAGVFVESAFLTILVGGTLWLATQNARRRGLSLQQTFVLTTGVWVVLPIFGAIPFVLGATNAGFTDAFFESMSGLTTTGATVFTGLDDLPRGVLLWRGMLQWLGGVGIIVVAMVFLPELRVGGMQIFKSEGFDTLGKILPRATQIASQIAWLYLGLTIACGVGYVAAGLGMFEAGVHAMTTIATGGFSSRDTSFAALGAQAEYTSILFMILAALPFVRYVQLLNGDTRPIFRDTQILVFLAIVAVFACVVALWLNTTQYFGLEYSLRKALFNGVSIITGTGYASADYNAWGGFVLVLFFYAGLVGGCAGSTSCSVKVFRYQLLFSAIKMQVRRIFMPSGVFTTKYQGQKVGDDVLGSVLSFFVVFFLTLAVLAVGLATTGLDWTTAISGAAAALANIGPGLGDIIGPAGNYATLNAPAKWLLIAGMLVGRLELMAVYILFTLRFWRN